MYRYYIISQSVLVRFPLLKHDNQKCKDRSGLNTVNQTVLASPPTVVGCMYLERGGGKRLEQTGVVEILHQPDLIRRARVYERRNRLQTAERRGGREGGREGGRGGTLSNTHGHIPSHPYKVGTEHVRLSLTRQTLRGPSAKRREVSSESHEGRAASY